MRPSAVPPMSQHLTVLLVTIPLAFSPLDGEDRQSTKTLLASVCPCQQPQRFREKALHREGQAQVCARHSALPCPPTADLEPDETVRRDHELDLHRLRQT